MAEMKYLNTRVQLKYDSYTNWTTNNPTLLSGEIAIAKLVNDVTIPVDEQKNAPVLFKVGPGKFNDLPWASALAADVYAWAKKETPDWNDFPALPIDVIDNGSGKFVTDVKYAEDKITISRSDVLWGDVKNAPDFALAADLGSVKNLTTTAKVAVEAINEHDAEIGTLTNLNTTDQTNLVAAINEVRQAVEVGGTGSVVTMEENDDPFGAPIATYTFKQGGEEIGVVEDKNSITTITAGEYMGDIDDSYLGEKGHHYYTINGKDWSGEIAEALDAAKKYADDNDANDNTAHTHIDGVGVKVTGNGGIDGAVKIDLDVKFNNNLVEKDNKKYLQILDATDNAVITEFDATEFVKDGMIESVELVQEDASGNKGQFLKITWNIDDAAGVDEDAAKDVIYLNVSDLVDVYTGGENDDITVAIDTNNVITATLNKTFAERSELSGYKTVQTAVANTITDKAHVLTSLTQNVNGEIAYTVDKLTPGDIGAYTTNEADAKFLTEAQVKAVKVDNATHADSATDSAKLGGVEAANYALKTDLPTEFGVMSVSGENENAIVIDNTDAKNPKVKLAIDDSDPEYNVKFQQSENGLSANVSLYEHLMISDSENITGQVGPVDAGSAEIVLSLIDKGVTTAKIADNAIGAAQTKAVQGYAGEDAEVWVFCCGNASTLIEI
jgi:hypothetical protein